MGFTAGLIGSIFFKKKILFATYVAGGTAGYAC